MKKEEKKEKRLTDVPPTKRCCVNCGDAFLNPRPEFKGISGLGKFPLCTCKHEKHRKILLDPQNESCEDFSYKK